MSDFEYDFDLFSEDKKADELRRRKSERERRRLAEAYAKLLNSEEGRRVFFDLLQYCGVFSDCFTGNSHTFFLEGRRAAGLYVFRNLCGVNPNALQKLVDFQRAEQTETGAGVGS